jgi:hypothetical protein
METYRVDAKIALPYATNTARVIYPLVVDSNEVNEEFG